MEEKRPGQTPERAIARSDAATAQRSAPATQVAPEGSEDPATLSRGDARAKADRADMRDKGFGDAKGEEGF